MIKQKCLIMNQCPLVIVTKREKSLYENSFTTHCSLYMLGVEIKNKKLSNRNKGRIC